MVTERWFHSYLHPGTQLFSILKVEPKLTCKMKVIRANHRLKNLCSALYGVTESRAQHDLNTADIFFLQDKVSYYHNEPEILGVADCDS